MAPEKSSRVPLRVIVFIAAAFALNAASAKPCVKMRDGESFTCMKFSGTEVEAAAKYGLRLAEPFKIVKHKLLKRGWQLDREYLNDAPRSAQKDHEMICGSGWDALCSTAFKRGNDVLYLKMSGTNDGTPLVYVGTKD
jgi:hypothetical protein